MTPEEQAQIIYGNIAADNRRKSGLGLSEGFNPTNAARTAGNNAIAGEYDGYMERMSQDNSYVPSHTIQQANPLTQSIGARAVQSGPRSRGGARNGPQDGTGKQINRNASAGAFGTRQNRNYNPNNNLQQGSQAVGSFINDAAMAPVEYGKQAIAGLNDFANGPGSMAGTFQGLKQAQIQSQQPYGPNNQPSPAIAKLMELKGI